MTKPKNVAFYTKFGLKNVISGDETHTEITNLDARTFAPAYT